MPVDGPSYLVGRTDKRVLTMFWSGTKNQCLWTGPESALQWVGEMDYNFGSRHRDWSWIKDNIPNSYGIMA